MCGRYTAAKDFNELIKLVGVIMSRAPFLAPRYNIAPTQLAPVIYKERHQPAMKLMRWGLIPSWAKDESVGNAHINARSETLQSRNAFRVAQTQNVVQVALEAGNSPRVVFANYRELVRPKDAVKWFGIPPAGDERVIQMPNVAAQAN